MTKAVLLDRDGVINEIVYYPEYGLLDSPLNPMQFNLLTDVTEALRIFNNIGLKVIIISNQPAIAKGKMNLELFEQIRIKMRNDLKKYNVHIDGEYYCFHHPEAKIIEYKVNCECRKPKPGLILQAAKDNDLKLSKCYVIGDGISDVQAGIAAGCKTILLGRMKCEMCKLMEDVGVKSNFIVPNLLVASKLIQKELY